MLELRLLGEFQILRDGRPERLPPSRKTRALLAYLVATGRPQRRERLSTLLWELPDDPRGALRWSLSKLRGLVDENGHKHILADRETAAFDGGGLEVDLLTARAAIGRPGLAAVETADLRAIEALFRGDFIEGLDLPNLHEFYEWCLAERSETRRLHGRVLNELVTRLEDQPDQAVGFARKLVRIDPFDEPARSTLVRLLSAAGRRDEAEQQYEAGLRALKELGPRAGDALTATWRKLLAQRRADRSSAPEPELSDEIAFERSVALPPQSATVDAGIVGRREELARLLDTLAYSRERRECRIALVTGEPGIGKTRLVAELTRMVGETGGTVLEGTCYEAEATRPLGPWIDLLRDVPAALIDPDIRKDLAPLLPEFADAETGDGSRDRMFGAVAELIAARAHSAAPVVIALDDIHWCDGASAELLHFVIRMNRHRPVLFAMTGRAGELPDNPSVQKVLRHFLRDGLLLEIPLGPLPESDTEILIGRIAGVADVARICTESAGNPLFALELARALGSGQEQIPRNLSELVRDRIDRLSQPAQEAVRWAAAFGRRFAVRHLQSLVGLELDELLTVLEMLERYSVVQAIEDRREPMGAYSFSHELVRRAVYYDVSEPRRRLMHERIARLLNEAANVGEALGSEVVRHAALAGDDFLAAQACVAAGDRSLRVFANREAGLLARRGMRHAERLQDPEQVKLLIELSRVLYAARRPDDLAAAADELERLAERALDYGALTHARLGFQTISYIRWEGGLSAVAQRNMLRAEMISRSGDEEGRIEALAEAARCLILLERDLRQAEALTLEAGALSARSGMEIEAVPGAKGLLCLHRGDLDEAVELIERTRNLARRDGNRSAEFAALEHLAIIEILRARYTAARERATEMALLAERLRQGSEVPCAHAFLALADYAQDGGQSGAALESALEELRLADNKQRLAYILSRAAALDFEASRTDLARTRAEAALELSLLLERPSEEAIAHTILAKVGDTRGDAALSAEHRKAAARLPADRLSAEALASARSLAASDKPQRAKRATARR